MVLLTLGIGLAAMNTGNNLVYIIFGMMLGFITASGVISEMSLRGLEVDWIFPAEMYAGSAATIRIILRNTKKKLPSFGITLTATSKAMRPRPSKDAQWIEGVFTFLPERSQRTFDLEFTPKRRGEFLIGTIKIETKFPFCFFRKYLTRTVNKSFIVFPEMLPLDAFAWNEFRMESERSLPLKGWGDSFWGIRDYADGDNPRMISWKSSAKFSRLMLRETEKEMEKKIWVSMEPQENWGSLNDEQIESAIAFAASFILKKFAEGFSVGFIASNLVIEPSQNRKEILKMLSFLALFNPHGAGTPDRRNREQIEREKKSRLEEPVDILSLWMRKSPVKM